MTEVASSPAAGLQVLSVRHYEAPPPANLNTQLVDPENAYATTKEEEWVTKKKVELTTKRQIETRVKRQVVLEDGKVVEDSGPIVTTNTTEDTEKQESSQTEHRHLGDDEPDAEGWVAVAGSGGVVKEVKERTVKSREEKEERLETEDIQHLGDISDEAYLSAIQRQSKEGGDLRVALEKTLGNELQRTGVHEGRIVHQSCKTKRVVDTDDKQHLSELQADGRVVTETRRTTEHEEVNNTEAPDEGPEDEDVHKSSSQHYTKTKDQEFVEYLANGKKIGEEMRYEAENVEGDRQGDPGLLPVGDEWDSLSARVRKMRRSKLQGLGGATPLDRKDALTKKPLDFDQEEETRKVETSKWLEHHFGSESRSSKDSIGDEDELPATGTSTSFINVTMKSTKSRLNGVSSPDLSKSFNNTTNTNNNNSSSRVFVSSPENGTSSPTSYFQGISEWKTSRETQQLPERPVRTSLSSQGPFKDRVQVLPTGPNHTFTPPKSSPSPPYSSSNLGSKNLRGSQGSNLNLNGRHSSGPESSSPFQSITEKHMYNRYYRQDQASPSGERNSSSPLYRSERVSPYERAASPYHAKIHHEKTSSEDEPGRVHRRFNGHVEKDEERFSDDQKSSRRLIEREVYQQRVEEPAPDYSPPSPRATPSPQPADTKKKIYQRTRFAADIPPVRTKMAQSTQTPHKSSLGESFRKFVGKFRSASKEKRRGKKGSRSPSPQGHTYQQYHSVDNHLDDDHPVAPPRANRHRESGTQTARDMRRGGSPVVTRYYLGEDPFGGSIYGREKEYDGVTPFRRKHRRGSENLEDERNARNQQLSANGSSTLGRLSKSTSRLISDRHNGHVTTNHTIDYTDRGGVQTLPRKLHDDRKKQVYVKNNVERVSSSPQSWESQRYSKMNGSHPNSHSMINVFIVNRTSPPTSALGPAKPARTYRSNLLRSKSFNVHAGDATGDFNSVHKSNPQLHRLDESPPPLKSPGIINSISRSTKDLSQAIEEENYRKPFNFNDVKSTGHLNGYTSGRAVHDTNKKIFMKNLQDKAPELFKTLHGSESNDHRKLSQNVEERPGRLFTSTPLKNGSRRVEYSNSFRSSNTSSPLVNGSDRVHSPTSPTYTTSITHTPSFRNGGEVVNRSVTRRGSNDDYSETVRITSKSDDPLRPSVTNTVQSFSKKVLPVKNGRGKETIESSETKTVTKSRYRGGERYLEGSNYGPRNGGVVIEVRNNAK